MSTITQASVTIHASPKPIPAVPPCFGTRRHCCPLSDKEDIEPV